jgi:hypothetical protein
MSIRITDGTGSILDYEAPDDSRLAEFDKYKKTLLDMLRDAYERGPKSKRFDEDKTWRSLSGLAGFYFRFRHGSVKQKKMPLAQHVARLRKLENALGKARTLVDAAMQDEVGSALYSSWWEATESEYAEADGHFADVLYIKREFERVVKGLAALETAASRAADDVPPPGKGRPKGAAILSWDDIWGLGALYRESTGSIPGAGDGPFAKFVAKVLTALGCYNDDEDEGKSKRVIGAIKYESVVDAIKDARQWALTNPVARKWGPSPFDEQE